MPKYLYRCPKGHEIIIEHGMTEDRNGERCARCKKPLHRVPQMPMVNWNGLPPHEADRRPKAIQDWLNSDTAKSRDKFNQRKEKK